MCHFNFYGWIWRFSYSFKMSLLIRQKIIIGICLYLCYKFFGNQIWTFEQSILYIRSYASSFSKFLDCSIRIPFSLFNFYCQEFISIFISFSIFILSRFGTIKISVSTEWWMGIFRLCLLASHCRKFINLKNNSYLCTYYTYMYIQLNNLNTWKQCKSLLI